MKTDQGRVAIIGGGFCGLAAGYELAKRGVATTIIEADSDVGGLAGSFRVNGTRVEKFYHHWFTNDQHITDLVNELGTRDQIIFRPTTTGMYYSNTMFRLSTPLDVLRFTPLPLVDRIRLGLLALKARRVGKWQDLEDLTAAEWLRQMGGDRVYSVVWEPLLRGKFGEYAEQISAVWFWNKLKLRGGSRGSKGEEQLAYYRGGYAALADQMAQYVIANGGEVLTDTRVDAMQVTAGRISGLVTSRGSIAADAVLATTALPIVADLVAPHVNGDYVARLRRIKYLANVCMVLELDRSLSSTYWLNVNDPGFPFVGIIEHTNFESHETYGGRRIAYLSRYLTTSDPIYLMDNAELLEFTLPHLKRMFPALERSWILDCHTWRARYAQPVVERRYSTLIPEMDTPIQGLHLASMAQIYPEDRGTNYAVREGRRAGRILADRLTQ